MAKEMNSREHRFRGFREISRCFTYPYSHSKGKMAMLNVNDIFAPETELVHFLSLTLGVDLLDKL